jgi:hypothetical protein
MISLNAHDTCLFLLTKGWEHKDVFRFPFEERKEYISRVINHLYALNYEYNDRELYQIYEKVANKLLTCEQVLKEFNDIDHLFPQLRKTPFECIECALSILRVKGTNAYGEFFDLIKLDESYMSKDLLQYRTKRETCYAIDYVIKDEEWRFSLGNDDIVIPEIKVTITSYDIGEEMFFRWIKSSKVDWRDVYYFDAEDDH